MFRWAWAWLLLLVCAVPAAAQKLPPFTGLVVDAANVLPPEVEADLTTKLDKLQQDTHRQLVVATIPDLQGYPIEEFGNKLIRTWGVGLKDVNNGAIVIVAPNDRKVRVEVGYGLEPILTDAVSSVTINEQILPRFKAGDLPGGVTAGTDALIAQLRAAPEEAKARADAAAAAFDKAHGGAGREGGGVPVSLIFWGVVLLFFVLPAFGRRRRGRSWAGGGGSNWPIVLWSIGNELSRGSGGSWGGGGGGSSWGGGGDSGGSSWGGGGFTGGGGGSGGGGGASGSW